MPSKASKSTAANPARNPAAGLSIVENTGAESAPVLPTAQSPDVPPPAPSSQIELAESDNPVPMEPVSDPDAPFGRRKDGTPAKRRGAKPGARTRDWIRPGEGHDPANTRALAAVDNEQRYRAMAEMCVNTTVGFAVSTLGQDWQFRDEDEKKFLTTATFEYFKAIKMPDLPPGWVLLGAIAIYAMPRIQSPATQEKLRGMFGRKNNVVN